MKMPPSEPLSLHELIATADFGDAALFGLSGGKAWEVAYNKLKTHSSLSLERDAFADRCVLISTRDQLGAALALLELDGVAKRMIVRPQGLTLEQIKAIWPSADIEAVVTDGYDADEMDYFTSQCVVAIVSPELHTAPKASKQTQLTEWVLFTSGTTGVPKMVIHTLAGLTGAIPQSQQASTLVWATFYDIRRYGGLQIFLRAALGRASLVLSQKDEPASEHLARLARQNITHISGTPSHWRRVLMSGAAQTIAPHYVRLSGEIADQGLLDQLKVTYPNAQIGHAYASTEGGVGFDVNDGLEGFPASYMGLNAASGVEMKAKDGILHVRSARTAVSYLGASGRTLAEDDGFIDTGDAIELRNDRYYFTGRKDGVINVGGLKVHPEEVEGVINRHPAVRMTLVRAQKSSIMGALVVADVVLTEDAPKDAASLQKEITGMCLKELAPYKVPAVIRFVPSLSVTAGGKLARSNA